MKAWERFLEKYTAFGQRPTVDGYVALFDPAGTVQHPGMAQPIGLDHIPDFISGALVRLPEYHLIPVHWSVIRETIFVEANNTALVNGKRLVWTATCYITLRGDRVLRGRAYYDRTEVLSHFEPALAAKGQNAHMTMLEGCTRAARPRRMGTRVQKYTSASSSRTWRIGSTWTQKSSQSSMSPMQ